MRSRFDAYLAASTTLCGGATYSARLFGLCLRTPPTRARAVAVFVSPGMPASPLGGGPGGGGGACDDEFVVPLGCLSCRSLSASACMRLSVAANASSERSTAASSPYRIVVGCSLCCDGAMADAASAAALMAAAVACCCCCCATASAAAVPPTPAGCEFSSPNMTWKELAGAKTFPKAAFPVRTVGEVLRPLIIVQRQGEVRAVRTST